MDLITQVIKVKIVGGSDGQQNNIEDRKRSWFEERLFDLGHHYKTIISNGKDRVEGRGATAKKAEEIANLKWLKKTREAVMSVSREHSVIM